MVFIFAKAEFHWQSKWFFRPRQKTGMTVEEYYTQFRDWKEEMISLSFPAVEVDYIDGFIENLRWDIRWRSSDYRSNMSGLINAFYNAKFEESMMFIEKNLKEIKANREVEELTVEEQMVQQPIEEQEVESPLSTTSFEDPKSAMITENPAVGVMGITHSNNEEFESATATYNSIAEGLEVNNLLDSEEEMSKKVVDGQGDSKNEALKLFDKSTEPIFTGSKSISSKCYPFSTIAEVDFSFPKAGIQLVEKAEQSFPSKLEVMELAYEMFDEMTDLAPTARHSFSSVSLIRNERKDDSILNKADYCKFDEVLGVSLTNYPSLSKLEFNLQVFDPGTDAFSKQDYESQLNVNEGQLNENEGQMNLISSVPHFWVQEVASSHSNDANLNHELDFYLGTEDEIDAMRKSHYEPMPSYVGQAEGIFVNEYFVFPFVCMKYSGCYTTESMIDAINRLYWHILDSALYVDKSTGYVGDRAIVLPIKVEWAGFVLNSRLVWKLDDPSHIDTTTYPLLTLFKLLKIKPFQEAAFTPDELNSRKRHQIFDGEGGIGVSTMPLTKRIKDVQPITENKDEQAISESTLNKLVGAADMYDLKEMEPPDSLMCDLRSYQKQALIWMTKSEKCIKSPSFSIDNDNYSVKSKLTTSVAPGLWDDLQSEHVVVTIAAWALANWAMGSEVNRSHIQELDRDGQAIMAALMAVMAVMLLHGDDNEEAIDHKWKKVKLLHQASGWMLYAWRISHESQQQPFYFHSMSFLPFQNLSCMLGCFILSDLKNFQLHLSSNSYDGIIIAELQNFVWDPGQNAIFIYILEDKDVFERVGKDVVLMDTTLEMTGIIMILGCFSGQPFWNPVLDALYASCCISDGLRDTVGALDDIGLIPNALVFFTAELEHYIWDPGSFVSFLQLSWEDFGGDFSFSPP